MLETPGSVDVTSVTEPVNGQLAKPSGPAQHLPGILVLHGSNGYSPTLNAYTAHLAAQGFVTFSLCYFGCPGRPTNLRRISLEYVLSAVHYLATLPDVDPGNVSVYGVSRGGELALLLGSYSRDLRSVMALYPSPWIMSGCCDMDALSDCAWTLDGACLPYLMRIRVEDIQGPVLIFVGQYDSVWPTDFGLHVASELQAAHHQYQLTIFPNVGHAFGASVGCLIGPAECLVSQGSSIPFKVEAYVAASRVTFNQTMSFIKSLATSHPIPLSGSTGPGASELPWSAAVSPTSVASPNSVVFRDDWADPKMTIATDAPASSTSGYVGDEHLLSLRTVSTFDPNRSDHAAAVIPASYADAEIEASATLTNPADDQYVSLACRSHGTSSREYRLAVFPSSGQVQLFSPSAVPFYAWPLLGNERSNSVHRGSQANILGLSCHGPIINATVNGDRVAGATDYTLRDGQMSIGVGQELRMIGGFVPPTTPAGATIQARFSSVMVIQR